MKTTPWPLPEKKMLREARVDQRGKKKPGERKKHSEGMTRREQKKNVREKIE